jgi:hypothetical protein
MSGHRYGDQRTRSIERNLRRKEFHMSKIMCELKATKKPLRELALEILDDEPR